MLKGLASWLQRVGGLQADLQPAREWPVPVARRNERGALHAP